MTSKEIRQRLIKQDPQVINALKQYVEQHPFKNVVYTFVLILNTSLIYLGLLGIGYPILKRFVDKIDTHAKTIEKMFAKTYEKEPSHVVKHASAHYVIKKYLKYDLMKQPVTLDIKQILKDKHLLAHALKIAISLYFILNFHTALATTLASKIGLTKVARIYATTNVIPSIALAMLTTRANLNQQIKILHDEIKQTLKSAEDNYKAITEDLNRTIKIIEESTKQLREKISDTDKNLTKELLKNSEQIAKSTILIIRKFAIVSAIATAISSAASVVSANSLVVYMLIHSATYIAAYTVAIMIILAILQQNTNIGIVAIKHSKMKHNKA